MESGLIMHFRSILFMQLPIGLTFLRCQLGVCTISLKQHNQLLQINIFSLYNETQRIFKHMPCLRSRGAQIGMQLGIF